MPDYEKLYHKMFNAATDAIELMPDSEAKTLLIASQQACEEEYTANEEETDTFAGEA